MSNSVCLDANLVVRFVLGSDSHSPIAALWQAWDESSTPLAAPTLLYYEVSNALHRYVRHSDLSLEEAAQALDVAIQMRLSLYGDEDLHRRAMAVAQRFALPATYDAHYVALAERLGAELWTSDRRLYNAVGDTLPWVHLV